MAAGAADGDENGYEKSFPRLRCALLCPSQTRGMTEVVYRWQVFFSRAQTGFGPVVGEVVRFWRGVAAVLSVVSGVVIAVVEGNGSGGNGSEPPERE